MDVRIDKTWVTLAAFSACAASAAHAEKRKFSITAETLGQAAVTLGIQAGLNVGISDPVLAAKRTRAVRGQMSVRAALDRLLAGTGGTYVFVDARSVRITRAPVTRPPAVPLQAQPPFVEPDTQPDIVVTASKQGTVISRYPGTVSVVEFDDATQSRAAWQGTEAIVERLPMLTSTSLGPGREKLFIRGVADSSFSGPSQATVGQYFGDVRLNYTAPDPDFGLYDIERVEVLEGPQGTLYGTGSLGGIVRLVPHTPDSRAVSGMLSGGITATQHGGTGGDVAATLNLPIVQDRVALRVVGYRSNNPGYIDDVGRSLSNVNHSTLTGARVAMRVTPGNGWTLDFGTALQTIEQRDGQYAQANLPPLTRSTRIAQPFDNHYALGYATIKKAWDTIELVSTTSYVDQRIATTYDATGFLGTVGAARFDENVATSLLSHETRIGSSRGVVNWVAGLSLVHSEDRLTRRIGDPANPAPILGVRNIASEAALFGQYTFPVASNVRLTMGGRITFARAAGEALDNAGPEIAESRRRSLVVLPMVGLSWQPREHLILFAQVQQGYRPGGLSVAATGEASAVERFDADRMATVEAGLRFGRPQRSLFSGSVTASYARWVDIQSDLIDKSGLPFTTNVGDGRIFGLEGQMTWRISHNLSFDAAFFANKSQLDKPAPLYISALDRELPSIAEIGGRAALRFRRRITEELTLTLDGSARYVGTSSLGIGTLLGLDQGGYTDLAVGGRLEYGQFGLSLDVRNAADVKSNRFAYGNPFTIAAGNQITPLRPRTIRIGFDAKF